MNFSDFVIDAEDFEFYESLPASERILFLYDLICDESYGPGSIITGPEKIESEYSYDTNYETNFDPQAFLSEFESRISSIIDKSIKDFAKSNVAFLNSTVVINSNYKNEIHIAAVELLSQGFLISKQNMTERMSRVFHKQKYCAVYKIIGHVQKFSPN